MRGCSHRSWSGASCRGCDRRPKRRARPMDAFRDFFLDAFDGPPGTRAVTGVAGAFGLVRRGHPLVGRQRQELGEVVGEHEIPKQRRRPPRTYRRRSAPRRRRLRILASSSSSSRPDQRARRSPGRPRSAPDGGATARPGRARSRRSRHPPSDCRSARSRCRAARPPDTGRRRSELWRRPRSVIVPAGTVSRSSAVTVTSSRWRAIWLAPGIRRSNTSLAIGTRPGCATQVPSWPSPASRSLSARTLASACVVGRGVVADRNLRRHAADRMGAAAMAGLDREQAVGAHEVRGHRHLGAIGQDEVGAVRGTS